MTHVSAGDSCYYWLALGLLVNHRPAFSSNQLLHEQLGQLGQLQRVTLRQIREPMTNHKASSALNTLSLFFRFCVLLVASSLNVRNLPTIWHLLKLLLQINLLASVVRKCGWRRSVVQCPGSYVQTFTGALQGGQDVRRPRCQHPLSEGRSPACMDSARTEVQQLTSSCSSTRRRLPLPPGGLQLECCPSWSALDPLILGHFILFCLEDLSGSSVRGRVTSLC